ncbi:MAG TPA: rhodanese-like domain-containing protein, partial [Thermoanaerobaculia bacterium]|nr:rhodanese-like domain-containing protein [Thermoanaerobaculia bacterium]
RRFNYALQPMSREEFVRMMTADLPEAPAHFGRDVELNRAGPGSLEDLRRPEPLAPATVDQMQRKGAVVLDTRPAAQYGTGHVPGSLHIGLSGQFASWAGTLIPPETPIVLVTEDEQHVEEAQTRLARVGLENVAGYLAGGILAWHESGRALAAIEQVSVEELRRRLSEAESRQLVDVRRAGEWQAGHIARAVHVPLHQLSARAAELDRTSPLTAICAGGYRSSIATSLLERQGFTRITNVIGGMAAWVNARFEVVA